MGRSARRRGRGARRQRAGRGGHSTSALDAGISCWREPAARLAARQAGACSVPRRPAGPRCLRGPERLWHCQLHGFYSLDLSLLQSTGLPARQSTAAAGHRRRGGCCEPAGRVQPVRCRARWPQMLSDAQDQLEGQLVRVAGAAGHLPASWRGEAALDSWRLPGHKGHTRPLPSQLSIRPAPPRIRRTL